MGMKFQDALARGLDVNLMAAAGMLSDASAVNKYGRAIDGVQTAGSDIWDRSTAAALQNTWLAPTAARVHTIVSDSANDETGLGTLTLTGQPADTQTCTIGTKVYTFQTVLTNVDGNVLIGASASATIDNLIAAINLAAGAGTTYALATTVGDEAVLAVAGAGDTMTLWDHTSNGIATTDTMDNASWGAATAQVGSGSVAVIVYYLPDWDTKETSETIFLHGTVGVAMSESAVMINRMKVIANGAAYGINAGAITATAASDATVTAQINDGKGQTAMAIYGLPSCCEFYMNDFHVGAHLTATPATAYECDFEMNVNEAPDVDPTIFINKSNIGTVTLGSGTALRTFIPSKKITGPAIIKFKGISTVDDQEGTAEFDGILVDI